MESYQAIEMCVGRRSEEHAKALDVSPSIVRKWKEDPIDGSGTRNPLDTIRIMIKTSIALGRDPVDAMAPIRYLEEEFAEVAETNSYHEAYSDLLREFAHLMQEHTAAIRDGRISTDESRRIHREVQHVRELLREYDNTINEATQ
jgi:hypothetical protein